LSAASGQRRKETPMRNKIERLIIAACIGAIAACVLCWVEFYPVLRTEEAIRVPETHPFGCPKNILPHGECVK